MYYPFVRKALFQLDPERAHEVTFQQLRRVTGTPLEMLVRQKVPARPVTCMGLTFKNPLGLAAGLDKNGECIDALGAMGFGSIEIGTVTPRPQPGNDKPRIFRLVDAEGLINRMGFNNHGVDNLVENVKKAHFDGVLGINIGKNKDTPVEHGKDDYLICMEKSIRTPGISPLISPRRIPQGCARCNTAKRWMIYSPVLKISSSSCSRSIKNMSRSP